MYLVLYASYETVCSLGDSLDNIEAKVAKSTNVKRLVHLKIGNVSINGEETSNSEAYALTVDAKNEHISIVGRSSAGVFWAIQTLLNLEEDGKIFEVTIRDEPRFKFRELGVDVARNFQPKEEIVKLIDVMSTYKLNVLHLHLTDDEGWRLEIPGLPELTKVIKAGILLLTIRSVASRYVCKFLFTISESYMNMWEQTSTSQFRQGRALCRIRLVIKVSG